MVGLEPSGSNRTAGTYKKFCKAPAYQNMQPFTHLQGSVHRQGFWLCLLQAMAKT